MRQNWQSANGSLMPTAIIILLAYFLGGLVALLVFDLATKGRIRNNMRMAGTQAQIRMAEANNPIGPRAGLMLMLVLTWLFWPMVLVGAVTGKEEVNTTLIITEGFGKMSMLTWTFDLLKKYEGKQASISGATHIRAGVIRPEIIIPLKQTEVSTPSESEETSSRLEPGTTVRIIRGPEFGAFAKVFKLESTSKEIETESTTAVIIVTLEDGKQLTLPRANVEIIGRGVSN